MAKITLNNIGNGTAFQNAISVINANNDAIEAAWENNLSRNGLSPNQMQSNLDMNSNFILNMTELDMNDNRITNLGAPIADTDAVRYYDLLTVAAGLPVSSVFTGTGPIVRQSNPEIITPTITNPTVTNPTITGGTLNNTVIGGVTPSAGTFTTLTTGSLSSTGAISASAFIPTGSSVPTNGLYLPSTNTLGFATNSGGKMQIDADGNVGIPSAATSVGLRVNKTITGATISYGVQSVGITQSDVTAAAIYYRTAAATAAASFTCAEIYHYSAAQSTIGAGSTVTNQYGFSANSSLSGASNNYGFHSNLAAATGRWNFYANGTARNYMAGALSIGTTTQLTGASLTVQGGHLSVGSESGQDRRIYAYSGDGTIQAQMFAFNALGGFVGTLTNHSFMIRTNDANRMTFDTSGNATLTGAHTAASFIPTSSTVPANGLYLPAANVIGLAANTTLVASALSTGEFIIGNSARVSMANSVVPKLQVQGTSTNTAGFGIARYSNDNGGPTFESFKSRGTTLGSQGVVQANDTLGFFEYGGSDGTAGIIAARIIVSVDGTPGTNDMPGRITFWTTPDGSNAPSERLRIDNSGNIGISTTSAYLNWGTTLGTSGYGIRDNAGVMEYKGSGGSWSPIGGGGGGGTVTSVGLIVPSIMSVSGSPVTTNGSITVSLANQTANTVFAGPSSGAAAAPTFRALAALDVAPALPEFLAAAYGVATANSAATNTTNLNTAIAAAVSAGGGIVKLPRGTLNLNALASIAGNNIRLVGQGDFGGTILDFNNATGDCITIGSGGHCSVEDVYITCTTTKRTSGYAIKVASSHFKPTIKNVRIDYAYNGIWMSDSSEGVIDHVLCRYTLGTVNVIANGTVGNGLFGLRLDHFISDNPYPASGNGTRKTWTISTAYSLNDIVVTNGNIYQCTTAGTSSGAGTGPSGSGGATGPAAFTTGITDGTATWKFVSSNSLVHILVDSYAYSLAIERSAVINGAYGLVMQDTSASGTSYPTWVYTWDLECDHNYYTGVQLTAGETFQGNNVWAGSCLTGNGINVASTFRGDVQLIHADVRGNWQHGVLWAAGPVNLNIQGGEFAANGQQTSNTFHNIALSNSSTDVIINGVNAGKAASGSGQTAYGVFGGSSLARVIVTSNNLNGNLTGGTNIVSAGTVVAANNVT